MKVLITSDVYKPLVNGVVTSIVNLTNELTKLGHEVRILTLSNTTQSYKDGNVYYLKSLPVGVYPDMRATVYYKSRFINELREWNPDIIHSQCEFISITFAEKIAEKNNTPIVHTYHTLYEQYADYIIKSRRISSKLIAKLSRLRLRNVDEVIVPTYKVKSSLEKYGVTNDIKVIPTGIDIEKFDITLSDSEKEQIKNKWNIPLDNKVLINVGRVGFEKSLNVVIDNFARTLKSIENITLLIVGDGPAKESLESQAKELGISDHVIFTGMICPNEVQKYYQLGDMFVCASTSETQGLTYIEAMCNGLPLVCQKDDCLEGVLYHGVNGFYFDNEMEFISGINTFVKDEKLCLSAHEFNKKQVKLFSKEQFGINIEKQYLEVIKKSQQMKRQELCV